MYNLVKMALSAVLLIVIFSAQAQVVGKQFPRMEAENVEDKIVILPDDKQDKFTLVGLAYSKKSEDDLNTWFSPVYHKFIKEDGGGVFAGFGYDVNVFFVPMFTGVNAAASGTAKKKAAESLDERLLPNILFYKGQLKPYKEALELDKKDEPYLFVINMQGKIVYTTSGRFSEDKLSEIEEVLEE